MTASGEFTIATSRYQARDLILASGLAPVRIALRAPKFPLGYELAGDVRRLTPTGSTFRLPADEFDDAFQAQLGRLDVDDVLARLQAVADAAGAPGVVLLCFEDVLAGESCHRRLVADWLEALTGQPVPDLGG